MLKTDTAIDGTPIMGLKFGSDKKVITVCNSCGVEGKTSYHNYILSQQRLHRNGETYCRHCASIITGKQKRGKKLHRTKPGVSGNKHHS